MKRIFLFVFCIGITLGTRAQFGIQAFEPLPNFVFEDVWTFSAYNLDTNFKRFYVGLRIRDDQSNLLVKSNSSEFNLSGTMYVNRSSLSQIQPLLTSYTSDAMYQNAVYLGGYFPAGNYNIELQLYGRASDGEFSEVATDNYSVTVELMWPPHLLTPPDEDTIDILNPYLSWTPAFSTATGIVQDYRLVMAEVFPTQGPYQALTSNPSFYHNDKVNGTFLIYPPGANAFTEGGRYVWQVHAISNGTVLGSSEIWTFVYALPENKTLLAGMPDLFFEMKNSVDEKFNIIRNKALGFVYDEKSKTVAGETLRYTLWNLQDATNGSEISNLPELPLAHGRNAYSIDICPTGLDLQEGLYLLEIYAKNGEKHYLKFYVPKNINCN